MHLDGLDDPHVWIHIYVVVSHSSHLDVCRRADLTHQWGHKQTPADLMSNQTYGLACLTHDTYGFGWVQTMHIPTVLGGFRPYTNRRAHVRSTPSGLDRTQTCGFEHTCGFGCLRRALGLASTPWDTESRKVN